MMPVCRVRIKKSVLSAQAEREGVVMEKVSAWPRFWWIEFEDGTKIPFWEDDFDVIEGDLHERG